ncbi:MAG: TPR end-of-group domain-containing protein [Bacillota bacterium]
MSLRLRLPVLVIFLLAFGALCAGWALAETAGAGAQASAVTDEAIARSRNRYDLGQMYQQAGDIERARQMYMEALDLWPDNMEARSALSGLIGTPAPPAQPPWWKKWLGIPGDGSGSFMTILVEIFGWAALLVFFLAISLKVALETLRLWILRRRGIPLLGLGQFLDPTLRLPGLPHYLATNMNDAGLTIYDEKGAILPDFNFIGETGLPQAKLLAKLMEMVYNRQFQRIHVEITEEAGLLHAAVSLADNATGYVRYLQVVAVDPAPYRHPGDLVKVMARLIADAILVSLSRDANTRGLLYQRMGDWQMALKEFTTAAQHARRAGNCGQYYQAHLNLGNLYSFLGLQDKSVGAYTEVAEQARNPLTLTLIQAALACSYRNWALSSPLDQRDTYDWLARQAIDKAVGSQHKSPLITYTIACYYSLSSRFEDCVRWLREAVSGDLAYLSYALSDPDMENLRRWLGDRPLTDALGMRL